MKYIDGYRFILAKEFKIELPFRPQTPVEIDYLHFDSDGILRIRAGYAWDGWGWPRSFVRGWVVRDAVYQMIRRGYLSHTHILPADRAMERLWIEDGVPAILAAAALKAVRVLSVGPGPDPRLMRRVRRTRKPSI